MKLSFKGFLLQVFLLLTEEAAVELQEYFNPSGFACPAVPTVPLVGIFFNMFLFALVSYFNSSLCPVVLFLTCPGFGLFFSEKSIKCYLSYLD